MLVRPICLCRTFGVVAFARRRRQVRRNPFGGHFVGALSEDMKRVVSRQRLGFVATVCPDGTPNLSPKGTLSVLDDDRLVFADIRSPQTVTSLRVNPSIEVNVVDP